MKIIGLVLISIFSISCNKIKNAPYCIQEKTENFKSNSICEEGSKVKEYKFQGEIVYLFENGNCGADIASGVFDSECNELGWIGGFTGNTKINGEEFSNARYRRTIWRQ